MGNRYNSSSLHHGLTGRGCCPLAQIAQHVAQIQIQIQIQMSTSTIARHVTQILVDKYTLERFTAMLQKEALPKISYNSEPSDQRRCQCFFFLFLQEKAQI